MDFPKITRTTSTSTRLYGVIPYISICGSHIRNLVEYCVLAVFKLPRSTLYQKDRNARTAFVRQIAMYLTHVAFGLTYSEVGRLFLRDRTTVAHACRVIEDSRDDPSIDHTLSALETALIKLNAKARLSDSATYSKNRKYFNEI